MQTKIFIDNTAAAEFIKELAETDNTIDIFKNKDGTYTVNWIPNKKYIAHDGKEFTDEVWTTLDRRMIHVQDLEPEHARNIIRMLLRNERELQQKTDAMLEQLTSLITDIEDIPVENRTLH